MLRFFARAQVEACLVPACLLRALLLPALLLAVRALLKCQKEMKANRYIRVNMVERIITRESGYGMRLADGQGWHIIPTEGVRSWVEKLALIMELKTSEPEGHSELIFIRG